MLDHNSEWQLTVCNNGCITDIYFTDGDTSYNNYSYKILNGYHYISRTFWLRENIQTEKVYLSFLQNNNRKEGIQIRIINHSNFNDLVCGRWS